MEHRIVGPGPYRATRLWNETVELFRAKMPLRKHRCRFKSYEHCFTAAEAVDWLHELLRCSQNFGPEVTRKQTVQLLKKFLKNHVIEDIKGKWGQEDFEDNRHLYRWHWKKALLDIRFAQAFTVLEPPKSACLRAMTKAVAFFLSQELPHWVLSAMKCLANWPNCSDLKQPTYLGFEKDVFKTIADYYGHLKEPLLTFHLFDAFVSVLGLLQKEKVAVEAFQICCLLLPPENRRKLQLLMRMMARICLNKEMPPLCDGFGTRTLMVQTFSHCILCSKDEVDLDELLAARLVTFLMDNYQEILKVPLALQTSIEERVAHLRRVQIKYPGADMDITLSAPSFCRQISPEEFEYQRSYGSQEPLAALLEEVITDAKLSNKEKKKKLKQFQKSYPEVYQERFPTPESEALLFPEKRKPKPQLLMWALKKPFQPFQRTGSFRM
ncbi:DEP domain-containing protein 1B [Hylobates moloch]|uniref:DEP domain-containing protein 1B n=1 Tax=Hylobates moloch TaxID=81572 RepID=UPI002676B42E|nr:DEP domain-containing protein 1B [Hylobates moloch]